jgi:hypothetical protein
MPSRGAGAAVGVCSSRPNPHGDSSGNRRERGSVEFRNQMFKLLLVLAAAAAIAVAASSSPLEFQDLHDTDTDDLLDDLSDELDSGEGSDSSMASDSCPPPHDGSCAPGFFRNPLHFDCVRCPSTTPSTPYGDNLLNCGQSTCFACEPNTTFDYSSGLCITPKQGTILRGGYAQNTTVQVQEDEDLSEDVSLDVNGCGSGKACCLPGFYGASSASCTPCPGNKPSSPFSQPGNDCTCLNAGIGSCFACKNKCAPYNQNTRMCTPTQCALGSSCKVSGGSASCVLD